ncbi:MAG TPA: ABC transporter permease subunit, partial [Treponemataceae bacterium]|nr:ABC transporter permease subunit [Treponemataceae bacterium]
VLLFGAIGGTTLEVAIYQAARITLDFRTAAMLALVETSVAILIIMAYSRLEKHAAKSTGIAYDPFKKKQTFLGSTQWGNKINYKEIALFVALALCILLFFILPLVSIIAHAFFFTHTGRVMLTFSNVTTLFSHKSFLFALQNTLQTALATATLSVTTGLFFALLTRCIDPYNIRRSLRILPLLPMAVSSVVMGFGITILVRQGTPLLLILAQSALYWPFAFRQISHSVDRIPKATIEAARLLSYDPLDVFFKVEIPLVKRSIFNAFAFCFAMSCGDASLPLVLAIPRYNTLALFTYQLAGSYRFRQACACGCILMVLSATVFLISSRFNKR